MSSCTDGAGALEYHPIQGGSRLKRGIVASAVILTAAMALLSSAVKADTSCCGLSIQQILNGPSHGDVIQFTSTTTAETPYDGLVFDQHFSMALDGRDRAQLFGDVSRPLTVTAAPASTSESNAQVLGLSFQLLGGQSSVSFVNTADPLHQNGAGQFNSQGPAVFAFYNFPQVAATSPLRNIFGFANQSSALASQATAVTPDDAAASFVSLPLVSSLSAQGPYWFGGYTQPLTGSSIQLNI